MTKNFVITGCSQKNNLAYRIALSIKMELGDDCNVIAIAQNGRYDVRDAGIDSVYVCDLRNPLDIADTCEAIIDRYDGEIYCLINCAGMNSNDWFENINANDYDTVMEVNAKAIMLMSQQMIGALSISKGTILNIVSNAAHVPMRCSLAYNASKAAARMITMQMARELTQKYDITVFSVSPNKLSGTEMTKYIDKRVESVRGWTADDAIKYQLSGLVTGVETDPSCVAEFIAYLLKDKRNHFFLSGCDIPYGA